MINKANFSQPSVPIGQIDTHLYSQTQSSETCLESGQYGVIICLGQGGLHSLKISSLFIHPFIYFLSCL